MLNVQPCSFYVNFAYISGEHLTLRGVKCYHHKWLFSFNQPCWLGLLNMPTAPLLCVKSPHVCPVI